VTLYDAEKDARLAAAVEAAEAGALRDLDAAGDAPQGVVHREPVAGHNPSAVPVATFDADAVAATIRHARGGW
jgi:hypothetical protein